MPVRLNSSGGGSVTMDVPAVGTTTTLNLPTVNGTLIASDNSGNVTYSGTTTFSGNATFNAGLVPSSSFLRNRIINGDMRIDQRNAGAAVTVSSTPGASTYTVDRWFYAQALASRFSIQQNAGAVTPPAGFTNYLGFTSLGANTPGTTEFYDAAQRIEGFNVSDLGWGAAGALPVTLSFWVRSSLTGTFSGSVRNATPNRSYPFTFTISSANTWEYKTVTIPGDTTGTWGTLNGTGIQVSFNLGAGNLARAAAGAWTAGNFAGATGAISVCATNGATFYVTGVQLEVGSVATPFERRQYGQEFVLCQRYFQVGFAAGRFSGGATEGYPIQYKATMRATPTITFGTPYSSFNLTTGPLADNADQNGFTLRISGSVDHGWTGPYSAAIEL